MSDPSDDLPWDVWEKLRILDLELHEGDITQKGYEKKKALLLKPYTNDSLPPVPTHASAVENGSDVNLPMFAATSNDHPRDIQSPSIKSISNATDPETQHSTDDNNAFHSEDLEYNELGEPIDLGPEPSAADVVDFLDYLPSPTHSPTRTNTAASSSSYFDLQLKDQETASRSMSPSMAATQPAGMPLSGSSTNLTMLNQYRPYPSQQPPLPPTLQQPPWPQPMPPTHPVTGLPMRPANRPMYDNRMPPRQPYPGAGPPPPAHGSASLQHFGQPPPQPRYMMPGYAPSNASGIYSPGPMYRPLPSSAGQPYALQNPNTPSISGNSVANYPLPRPNRLPINGTNVDPSLLHHNPGRPVPPPVAVPPDPSIPQDMITSPIRQQAFQNELDWETMSMRGRESSSVSIRNTSRYSGCSFSEMGRSQSLIRRSASLGRSRYGDSYMATTFKAIEPAPQPKLMVDDPNEQMMLMDLAGRQMLPLKPREVPFDLKDTITQTELNTFTNLAEVLRFRGTQPSLRDSIAFTLVDAKGKEPTTLTWDKLNAKAQKLAIQIRDRSKVALGDRVALIYRKSEVLDFIVAMFGCFLAGVVAVPINAAEDLSELSFILNLTNATLVLTTDHNLRAFNKDMQSRSIELPGNIDWWKTNDIGTWYPPKKKSEYPPIKLPELAYIEFAKAPNGELKGVTVAHQTIMSECKVYQAAVTETNVTLNDQEGVTLTPQSKSGRPSADCLVSYLEPRQQIGLVVSVLCTIFSGNHSVFTSASVIDTPAVWIYILSKYKATIALADYPSLKFVTHFYQTRTKEVLQYSKKIVPDLSSLRFLFVDTNVVKPDLDEYIADKLLTPLGNTDNPLEVVCPVISLAEHGGFILSFRDNLGPARLEEYVIQEEKEDGSDKPLVTTRSALATGHSKDVWQCLLDVEALKMNKVVVVAAGDEARKTQNMNEPGRVRVGSFGFAIPEATIAIVDPDTTTLCPPDTIGEIWIDAPSLSGGFWALAKHTEAIFHARPIIVPPDTFYPELYNQEFLRTGLCGTMIGGRLVIFGTYEDRIRQQRLGATLGIEETHFTSDIVETLNKRARIEQCAAFEITVNDQHMPIVACESSLDRAELRQVAGDIDEALLEYNGIRVYAVLMVANNALPRHLKHGRRQIHALMVKRAFMAGKLPIRSVKMDVDRTVFNLGMAEDPTVNIWQTSAAYDTAIRTGLLPPVPRQQHTGIEPVEKVVDERTELDLAQFTNIIDVLQWRTKLYPEETAFVSVTHSNNGTANTKAYSWRKMNTKVVSVANYLSKKGYKRGHKALILMPYSVEWIYCIYACFVLGIIAVPIEPPDPQQQSQRIKEDVLSYIGAARELGIDFTVVNSTSDDMLKSKTVHPILKQEVHKYKSYKLPDTVNISKASRTDKLLGRESGWSVRAEWAKNYSVPCMISIQYGADATKFYSYLNHATIMNQCRTQKTTCQMKPPRGLVATGLGGFDGLGLLHSVFCGVYVGCVTVVIPLAEFYVNPMTFFEMLQRYKAKDVFVNQALMQYAMNRITPAETRRLSLQAVQNFMLAVNGTPNPILYQHVARYLAGCRLPKGVINNVYSHFANPMVTTRSYMLLEPLPLLADAVWLRQGIIRTLPPEDEPFGVLLHDSGIVPSNTMVAIVNPETQTLCPSGMIGEIWVASDSNIRSFHGLEENARLATFECSIAGTDPRIKYMRTGDLGFLWNVQRRVNNASTMMEEGQCLFVLGAKSEKIERNGLVYFPSFVESSIERSHPALQPGGSVILQIANEIIVIAAIKSSENAVSAVPLIVSAVLEKHAFLIDTVVMIPSHQLPRSRFGDKQRKKTLALYTEKKLSAIYVKRITNQHEPLSMPEWSQSQLSLDYDTMSVRTRPLSIGTRSIAETAVDSDHSHLPRQQEPIGNHRTSLPSTPSKQMSMS